MTFLELCKEYGCSVNISPDTVGPIGNLIVEVEFKLENDRWRYRQIINWEEMSAGEALYNGSVENYICEAALIGFKKHLKDRSSSDNKDKKVVLVRCFDRKDALHNLCVLRGNLFDSHVQIIDCNLSALELRTSSVLIYFKTLINKTHGLHCDECFGFDDDTVKYLRRVNAPEPKYQGTLLQYVLEVELGKNPTPNNCGDARRYPDE